MSGYCAIGSVERAMMPTSVMTMLITPAKIGRSMKKCGKFIPTAVALWPRSFSGWGWSGASRGVWPAGGRLFGYRRNLHPGLQQLQPCRNDFLAVLQPAFYNPFSLEDASGLEVAAFDGSIRFHDECVFQSLLRTDHSVCNQCRPIWSCTGHAHSNKETRRDEIRVPIL